MPKRTPPLTYRLFGLPKVLLEALDTTAAAVGVSRSQFLRDAIVHQHPTGREDSKAKGR